jgi:heme O synthase-like polyprenyltransferase
VGDTETDLCDDYHRPLPAESVSSEHTFCSARSLETPMVSITTIVLVMLAAVLVVAGIVLSERAH